MKRVRWLVGSLVWMACALAPTAPAWGASVSLEESRTLTAGPIGFFFFNAATGERNSAFIRFGPGSQILVRDSAGLTPGGKCVYPDPLRHTLVSCTGSPGVRYGTAFITLGDRNDRLVVRGVRLRPRTSISAGLGNDFVVGGPGVDTLFGAGGADRLQGAAGADIVFGEAGNDRLLGGPGNDRLEGSFGNDVLLGQTGNDFLLGGPGNDLLFTGPGFDRWIGGDGINFVDGRRER